MVAAPNFRCSSSSSSMKIKNPELREMANLPQKFQHHCTSLALIWRQKMLPSASKVNALFGTLFWYQCVLGTGKTEWLKHLSILLSFYDSFHDLEKNSGLNWSKRVRHESAAIPSTQAIWPRESKWGPSAGKWLKFVANETLYQLSYDPNHLFMNEFRRNRNFLRYLSNAENYAHFPTKRKSIHGFDRSRPILFRGALFFSSIFGQSSAMIRRCRLSSLVIKIRTWIPFVPRWLMPGSNN